MGLVSPWHPVWVESASKFLQSKEVEARRLVQGPRGGFHPRPCRREDPPHHGAPLGLLGLRLAVGRRHLSSPAGFLRLAPSLLIEPDGHGGGDQRCRRRAIEDGGNRGGSRGRRGGRGGRGGGG